MRVLVICHGHPTLSKGGGEIAAFQLFTHLNTQPDIHAWFLGCDTRHVHGHTGSTFVQPYGPDEFLYMPGSFDGFHFANRDPAFPEAFAALLAELEPDVIHFHHYLHIGVEAFHIARRTLPNCKIILTLHEYLAICNYYGQMITPSHRLCTIASPASCNTCFPSQTSGDFFLRQRYIQRFFSIVDHFVAPSHFLAHRYEAWGLPSDRVSIIENLIAPSASTPTISAMPPSKTKPLRFGFFGQISALKGIDLLYAAASMLHQRDSLITFSIHGDYRGQPTEFQTQFLARLADAPPNIVYHGPYLNDDVDYLMQQVHAVIMPSIWWENSPVVIQEAYRNRRPILCARLGGMAEKVRHGSDGFHFDPGSAASLVDLLEDLTSKRLSLTALQQTMQPASSAAASLAAHITLYRQQPKAAPLQPAGTATIPAM